MERKLRIGLCGFGGLGHVHANSLATMPDADLVAVCDIDPAKLHAPAVKTNLDVVASGFDVRTSHVYTDFGAMLSAERLDGVVTALPSDLHAEYAIRAMEAGCHVFSEKPMALTFDDARRMVQTSRRTGRQLLVGQCLRFWGEYVLLAAMVKDQRHGRLLSLAMERVGAAPRWGSWFLDCARSGGAIMDLHLHDVDWCLHALGWPVTIAAGGATGCTGGVDDVTAVWTYADGTLVTLRGSWMAASFSMGFRAFFERATVDFGAGGGLAVTPKDGGAKATVAPAAQGSAYYEEMRYFLDRVRDGGANTRCAPESAADAVQVVELERAAIASRRVIVCASERVAV